MSFDDDIALTQIAEGRYGCDISPNYWLVAGPNGGYLAALLAHAGEVNLGSSIRQLRGLTVHYLRPPVEGPASIDVNVEQLGRSVAFQRLTLHQNGKKVLLATGAWADSREGIEHRAWPMPETRDPEACPSLDTLREDGPFPIHHQWEIRSVTGRAFGDGGAADLTWWIRPPEHRPLDGTLLIAMADAMPPPIFMVGRPTAGVPTLDLTMHTRAELDSVSWEPGDWVLARFITRHGSDGYVEEDGELWSADGTLLAQSRQLALAV